MYKPYKRININIIVSVIINVEEEEVIMIKGIIKIISVSKLEK